MNEQVQAYIEQYSFVRLILFKDHINVEARAAIEYKEELTGYKITPKGMVQIYGKSDCSDRSIETNLFKDA